VKILVTGGTGFIGRNLIRKLSGLKHEVRCLVRRDSNVDFLKDNNVELFYGDITVKKSIKNLVDDIEVVFHLIGVGNICAISQEAYNRYYEINVIGTKNLLEECRQVNLKKFIYFSSIAAMGLLTNVAIIDENNRPKPTTPYERSKFESEKIVLEYYQKYNVPAVIIRSSMVYGQGAVNSEILRICKFLKKYKFFPIIGNGNSLLSLVHVNDVVDAAYLAAIKGTVGRVYIITENSYTLNQLVDQIVKELDIKIFKIKIPITMAYFGALVIEKISQIVNSDPYFTRQRVRSVTTDRVYSVKKATIEIGYTPRINLEKGLKDTINWYKTNNYIF
jgi:nucleoside-diphosphate-sugar epimerase